MKSRDLSLIAIVTSIVLALPAASFLINWKIGTVDQKTNGWQYNLSYGNYGNNILLRAAVARAGLGAHRSEEAMYFTTAVDSKAEPLQGANTYRIHFVKDNFPPVGAFWSLTVIKSSDFMLVPNSIYRYSIGDRTQGLIYNNDGSLDIYLQQSPPDKSKTANWLPVPPDRFIVVLRTYEPEAALLNGTYKPPAIVRESHE